MLTLRIAFRNILRQKRRSLLTGLSMTGGYMLFVFAYSLLEGSYGNIIDIFTLDNTGHIQVHKEDYLDKPKIYKSVQDRATVESTLSDHPKVKSFTPRVFSPALAYGTDKTAPSRVIGVDTETEPTVSRLREKVSEGNYFSTAPDADGYYEAMIGHGLATSLKIGVADEIVLISQGADGSIANDIFVVAAIIGNRTSFDRMAVYLPLATAQAFLAMGGDVHEYALLIDHRDNSRRVADELAGFLPDLTVSPWEEVQATFYRTMQSDRQGNNFMMGLIVFIVFIGVLNTVLMSVLERTREFGVLRAIGARPASLIRLITLETSILATISVLLGMVLIAPMVYWLSQVGFLVPEPIDMGGIEFQHMTGEFSLQVFLTPMMFMLATAILISIPPGIRAARILPKEAMGAH
ncbi:MAG: ABC transporter permease [Pseudomonadales bacterium]|nr:ABC transporter permease [Pseudomonadales bacterium]MBO6823261.1 ABC transporter permease [Pseudomonadales bacterium]